MPILAKHTSDLLQIKPMLFAVGLEKCGTTSLNNYLALAKNVSCPRPKELEYFSRRYDKGEKWFLKHHNFSKDIWIDFTPMYHRSHLALQRIQADCHNKAIILLLRHPIERAFSAYTHQRYWFFLRKYLVNGKAPKYAKPFSRVVDRGDPFVFPSYTKIIQRVISVFGRSLVSVIPLELLLQDVWRYLRPVEETLNCSIELDHATEIPRSNALYMPQFFTGRQILDIEPEATDLITDVGATYVVRGGMPRKIATEDVFGELKRMEEKWLQPVDAPTVRMAFVRYYERETAAIEKMLSVNLDAWRVFKDYHAKTIKPLSLEAAWTNREVAKWHVWRLFSKAKMPKEAIALLDSLMMKQPNEPAYHRLMAQMLFQTCEYEGADMHSLIATELAPQSPHFQNFRSMIAKKLGARIKAHAATTMID